MSGLFPLTQTLSSDVGHKKAEVSRSGTGSADFLVCCIADFQVGRASSSGGDALCLWAPAGLETCDTADLEVCATFQPLHLR